MNATTPATSPLEATRAAEAIPPVVLVCDLDGTLIRSDMLDETFWAALSVDWRSFFGAVGALARGRAALKAYLAGRVDVDPATLPYVAPVLERLRAHRAAGGRTALVTAADAQVAQAIADHLGLFDEVHGSDGTNNLKGPAKAAFLADHFGAGAYDYIGDAPADLPVWAGARAAVTVGADPALRARVVTQGGPVTHIDQPQPGARLALKAMRPHQWLKNVLIFLPLLAAHALSLTTLVQTLLAFACFSLTASGVYVLNDLLDLSADRAHPRKRRRPFASGDLPLRRGMALMPALFGAALLIALLLGPLFLAVMLVYFVTTMAYSMWLKRRAVIDICVLAGLYTLRIVAGGAAADIPLSVWLLAFSTFFFFSLAAVKRQAELRDTLMAGGEKAAGRGYEVGDLEIVTMMALASGYVAVLVMTLYVNAPNVTALYTAPQALWGICAVLLYWISRMVMLTHRGRMHDDPVVFAATDRVSQISFLACLAFFIAGAQL
ncbi:UbiA family prenyltransferase [Pseudooceanicola nanhaiensis]|uniref:UbiA family prenyltransferase n=1 Tax=Pseudooceanicola nanhaiensis TaxID=375761 RepID=UPI001CD46EF9|nr:UbiA family prenyltransferase [Pseudooceanicola nanhaiensis]MCA0919095.1 UbiA family prenyltransferase [Pseudooceanicola nanhaiensis]